MTNCKLTEVDGDDRHKWPHGWKEECGDKKSDEEGRAYAFCNLCLAGELVSHLG